MADGVWKILEPRNLELGPHRDPAAPKLGNWRHWKLRRDEDDVLWLVFDKSGASANTLSQDVILELDDVLAKVESETAKGLVLRSAKPAGFIAGADVNELREAKNAADIEARLTRAHAVVDRLDRLKLPTIAVIHGYCLGGGLEIALACDYRIATEDASLGFPEVLLGLHPGLGGTVRAPRLINPLEAMTMMLTGRPARARRAKSLGLVDAVTQERHVRAAVRAAVTGALKTTRSTLMVSAFRLAPARALAAKRMRAQANAKAPPEHYPAPSALIDAWEHHGGDMQAMQKAEIASFSRLVAGPTAQNLIRVFALREKLKSLADGGWEGRRVHVIGAGAMGGDIAAWCAWRGFQVTLADMKAEPLGKAIARAASLFDKIAHRRIDVRDALDRLTPDVNGDGVALADLVIEAVPEVLDLKRKIYAGIEPRMRPHAILATNTSSIPLDELCEGLARPQRLLGLHFFNPVSRMQLVEVISHDKVAPEVLAAGRAFLGRIDRLPAPVKSAPGFLVNRALTPYLLEAMVLFDEGVKRETIDKAAESFGMPVGPIELADEVGLDICLHVAEMLKANLGRKMPELPNWLREKVAKGELGRKTGKGLYDWKDDKPVKDAEVAQPTGEMTNRLILPMLDVCVGCLREGVVADEDTVDAAMIFATGFAPFRGGPTHYARAHGVSDICATLMRFAQRYGDRFFPDPGWNKLA
ncbi:MAG TPA: 3-hydroxyacyl-CoA dehydrogenase NAD-binding domain-containing protein [Xanthobacteraceae bacterium]|nr:3-hydroxyacyl-CoA dehydrogenase NAD-binding domain-containing protein [Xanthobacteraceae bacterium]